MAKFDVLSLFGVNVDFAYFNAFELIEALGWRSQVLKTSRVASLIKKHGKKHHIVSIVIRQVALAELKPVLNDRFLAYDASFLETQVTTSEYERRYEAEEKLLLICYSLALGKSVVSVKRLKGHDLSKGLRDYHTKGRSLYNFFRQTLNDNTREYVLSYKNGQLDSSSTSEKAEQPKPAALPEEHEKAVPRKKTIKHQLEPTPYAKEIEVAISLMQTGVQLISDGVKQAFVGVPLELSKLIEYCQKLTISYRRNPHALLSVRYLQSSESYAAQHAVACAILACHLANALKLEQRYVEGITLGALLFDVGRFKLPEGIANKEGKLTEAEFNLTRKHLNFAEAILAPISGIPKVVYQMLWEHHERMDGSGYPQGKIESEISVYGKIGAIIDAYDSLTSEQAHRAPLTPTDALLKMQKESGLAFDQKLLKLFTASLGEVPVGSCVELSNGRLGFVLTLNQINKPSLIRQVYSLSSKAFIPTTDLVLGQRQDAQIVKVVLPTDYNLRLNDHIA